MRLTTEVITYLSIFRLVYRISMVVYHRASTAEHPGSHFACKVYVRDLDMYCWYDGLEEPQLKISTLRFPVSGGFAPASILYRLVT